MAARVTAAILVLLLSAAGAGAQTYQVLHSFTGTDGAHPRAPLVEAPDGYFYGTAELGGQNNHGVVFKMDASGNVTVLHHFVILPGTNGGGTMTTLLVTNVANGTLGLAADGGFTYTPTTGFSGPDSFTYRAVNTIGASNIATVAITINAGPPTAQPPTGLYASAIVGNTVTLRWTPPTTGLTPTGYALEGGINPGQVVASIATGSTSPIFTFTAPTGAFYVRMHVLSGANKSAASSKREHLFIYRDFSASLLK